MGHTRINRSRGAGLNTSQVGSDSRVSVGVLDATQVSLQGQEDAGVSGAAVLQQGGGRLPGALGDPGTEAGGYRIRNGSEPHLRHSAWFWHGRTHSPIRSSCCCRAEPG